MSVRRRSLVLDSARRHQLIDGLVSAVPSVLPTELLDSSDFVTFDFVSFGGLAVDEWSDSILLLSNASAGFFFRQNTISRFQFDLGATNAEPSESDRTEASFLSINRSPGIPSCLLLDVFGLHFYDLYVLLRQ